MSQNDPSSLMCPGHDKATPRHIEFSVDVRYSNEPLHGPHADTSRNATNTAGNSPFTLADPAVGFEQVSHGTTLPRVAAHQMYRLSKP